MNIMECECGYRRSRFNIFDEIFMLPHKWLGHKRIDLEAHKEVIKDEF